MIYRREKMLGIQHLKNTGNVSVRYTPETKLILSHKYAGNIIVHKEKCSNIEKAMGICPTGAINSDLSIDFGKCIYCKLCAEESDAFEISQGFTVIVDEKECSMDTVDIEKTLREKIKKKFKRSLGIREVDAGSCNGCDLEIQALNNPINDIEQYGIHFVASPRHADILMVTGPVSRNMAEALKKTYEQTPNPKLVIAVGSCTINGGIYNGSYAIIDSVGDVIPVDVYIPGCPPRPQAILLGIYKAIEKL
jgi:Ni,Fe-hydrogenase III small subunit/ferredoxin